MKKFATTNDAAAAGILHLRRRHPTVKTDRTIAIVEITPRSKPLRAVAPGPYVGVCQVCTEPVTAELDDFNEADDLAEEHRWKAHPEQPDVVVGVVTRRA